MRRTWRRARGRGRRARSDGDHKVAFRYDLDERATPARRGEGGGAVRFGHPTQVPLAHRFRVSDVCGRGPIHPRGGDHLLAGQLAGVEECPSGGFASSGRAALGAGSAGLSHTRR